MPLITLVNLGGPRNTDEIEPFRRSLSKFIAKKRAPRVAVACSSMGFGGGSPLVSETQKQADHLAEYLTRITKKSWKGRIAMTCGFPNVRDLPKDELLPYLYGLAK